jgi:DNA-3-methyladenine glycosylase
MEIMRTLRNRADSELTNGPAKLAQALDINKAFNGANLCQRDGSIWIEEGIHIAAQEMATGPRIGLGQTPEPWFSLPWRYWVKNNPSVSR